MFSKMSSKQKLYISYLAVFLWMGIIFYFSSRSGDVSAIQSTEMNDLMRESIPGIHSFIQKMSNSGVVIFSIRKLAHIFLYMVLTILLYMPTVNVFENNKFVPLITMSISIIYAALDEVHQLFVPGRSGQIQDVMIDGIGVIIGMGLIILVKNVVNVINRKSEKSA